MRAIRFKLGNQYYYINGFALLLWISGGGLNALFTGKLAHVGIQVTVVAGVILQFMTTQDAPAKAVVKNAPATSDDGHLNGQKIALVERTPQDYVDTPPGTTTPKPKEGAT
jgi:hypothetical protein